MNVLMAWGNRWANLVTTSRAQTDNPLPLCSDFSFLMFAMRACTVVMYLRAGFQLPQKTWFCVRKGVELACFAVAWLICGIFQRYVFESVSFIFTWWGITLADLIVPLVTPRLFPQKVGFVAINIDMLIERFGLFFVTALGNFVVMATLIPASLLESRSYSLSAMIICIAFSLKLSYHDCNIGTNDDIDLHALRWRRWTGVMWILLHIPMTAGITVMSAFFGHALTDDSLTNRQRWYLCCSTALVIFCLSALQLLHKKSKQKVRVGPWIRLFVRFVATVVVVLLPLVPEKYLPLWALFLSILLAMLSYTLLDLFGNIAVVDQPLSHADSSIALLSSASSLSHPSFHDDGFDLADIFSTAGVHKSIHGHVVGGEMRTYGNVRLTGRDLNSSYI